MQITYEQICEQNIGVDLNIIYYILYIIYYMLINEYGMVWYGMPILHHSYALIVVDLRLYMYVCFMAKCTEIATNNRCCKNAEEGWDSRSDVKRK